MTNLEHQKLLFGTGVGNLEKWHPIIVRNPHYFIHTKKLGQGVLSISRQDPQGRMTKISGFKNREISKAFSEAIRELLQKQKLPDLSDLPQEERDYLLKILALITPEEDQVTKESFSQNQKRRISEFKQELSRLRKERALKSKLGRAENRLKVLIGEASAGNTENPMIVAEGTKILNTFVKHGVISLDDARRLKQKLVGSSQ